MRFVNRNSQCSVYFTILDLVGFALASLVISWISYGMKNMFHEKADFDFWGALVLFVVFATTYALVASRIGNARPFALKTLAVSSTMATFVFLSGWLLLSFLRGRGPEIETTGIGMSVFVFVYLFSLNFVIVLSLRLIVFPLLGFGRFLWARKMR